MKPRLIWIAVICVSIALWSAAVLLLYAAVPVLQGDPAGADPIRIGVDPGTSLRRVADSLHTAGVVQHPVIFERYAVLAGFDRQIRAGEYEFVAGESYKRILERLREGDIVQLRITIREGLTNREIALLVKRQLGFEPDSFLALTTDPELLRQYNIDSPSLEGYLFPDTYFFPTESAPRQVVEALLQRFFTAWTSEHEERARALGMTRGQVLTLASIIEGEVLVSAESRRVSAVYHNRLRRNMLLQADPTVLYALGGVRRRVLYRDLTVDSPYNTYVNLGLPPGPINNPGLVAIEAALDPLEDTRELYFVAAQDGSGRHVFSRTFREHLRAKRQAAARLGRRNSAR
ncbi:MAG: endolytic transglycosylase MltG [Candidatus Latescibacterota bacterium]|nr:MAG: endolytic transglycosylase MltG [Candidatus Latescibacterota bacterium]